MKRGCLFLLSIIILVLFTNVMEMNAVNTGFKIVPMPDEEINVFVSNCDISLIDEEPAKISIICFDVNINQLIAVGQNTSDRKTICVYSNEGVFQYGYTFNCSGDFGVEWDEENLIIYFVRSSVIVSITPKGEIIDVFEVQNTTENNSYVNNFIHATKRTIGEDEYFIDNTMGILNWLAPSYSQIVVKDSSGIESVIYDVGSSQLINMIAAIVIILIIVIAAVFVVARG